MSFPNIPDINPKIELEREEVINLLLSSIAFEELGLAHIINAEGEKLQASIEKAEDICDLLEANKSVEKMLRSVIKNQMLLQFKMDDILEIPYECDHHHKK